MSKERLIAVIDDDGPFRVALVELLSSIAFVARGFASAEEYLASDDADSYDCIIADIHMPGMSGIELLQILESRELHIPVILVTAQIDLELKSKLQSTSVTCLLGKPFGPDALIACLEKALTA